MRRSYQCLWLSISESGRTGWRRRSSFLITPRVALKCCPVRPAQQPGQVQAVEQKGMNDHTYDREVYHVGKKQQRDAKHDCEHCRLICVRAAPYCHASRYPHWYLVGETPPPCRECNGSFAR